MESNEVVVTDIRMKFTSMVAFMIKWVIASIPSILILASLWFIVPVILTNFLSALISGFCWF